MTGPDRAGLAEARLGTARRGQARQGMVYQPQDKQQGEPIMTQQPQYPQYGPSQPSPQGPVPPQGPPKPPKQPAPKKHTTRTLVLTGVAALILGLMIGTAPSGNSATDDAAGPAPTVTVTVPNTGPSPDPVVTPTNTPPPPAPKVVAPTVKDFKLTVKTLTKQCFGSAGCNVTFRILVAYSGPDLDPGKSYEVLYEVRGGEDGPIANKLTVEGGESSVDEEEMVSTPKSSTKLVAVVTDVMES